MSKVQKVQDEARQRLLHDIEICNAALQRQLEVQDDTLAKYASAQMEDDEAIGLESLRRDPRDIPAEEALDTIVRLENTLKVIQRRNQLIQREVAVQEKLLKDRMKILDSVSREEEYLVSATGWSEQTVDNAVEIRHEIHEMIDLEQTLQKEMVSAEALIRKKEKAVELLELQLREKKEKEELLGVLYNDIRVKDRDCVEMQRSIDALTSQHHQSQELIEVARSKRGVLSIQSLRGDTESLRSTVQMHRDTRRRQDEVTKAQIFRAKQLQTRIDILTAALKDMKLDKDFERSIPKSSLVPGAAKDEPSSRDDVVPQNELVPVESYYLLARDNDAMRTSVARKDVMVLEKEATIHALEAKLESFTHSLNLSTEQQDSLRVNKATEMDELQETLHQQHQAYRRQIEELLSANLRLKTELNKAQQMPQQSIGGGIGVNQRMKF
eukprot:CAMPEP_0176412754 /NCGR_PEP_ID=MMETSP0127-20121128/4318_1 /TAXON_ID=938130 /ORGANISM="Platyophrya macrostoma, Strain WH" /LENGTH=439 /DNA_ID=CAMNT_0017792457 /DNA_START=21 /DNA_END=1339 /DNA_ORIENTATION=+